MGRERYVVIAMDENARRIFDEAFATLARTAHVTVEHRDHSREYWERPEPKPALVQRQTLTDSEMLRWQAYVSDQIAAALAARDALWRDVHGAVIAAERKRWRAEIANLELPVDALTHEATKRQTIEAAERERGDDGVVDLPQLPLRSVRRA